MNDPKRWVQEGGNASVLERELFSAGRAVRMSPEERGRHWLAIAQRVASVPVSPRALPAKAAQGLVHAAGFKTIVAVSLLAGAGASAYFATHANTRDTRQPVGVAEGRSVHEARVQLPDVAAPSDSARVVEESSPSGSPRVVEKSARPSSPGATAPPSPPEKVWETAPRSAPRVGEESTGSAPGGARTTAGPDAVAPVGAQGSRLAEEAKVVLDARSALESGEAATALHLLDDARRIFPTGSLGQEREALTIEALARTGRRVAASERARAFLKRFPNSAHASNVGRFLVEP